MTARYLHMYGQTEPNDNVVVWGDVEALLDLAGAIREAIGDMVDSGLPRGSATRRFMCSDGESYCVAVDASYEHIIQEQPTPYLPGRADLYAIAQQLCVLYDRDAPNKNLGREWDDLAAWARACVEKKNEKPSPRGGA